jgi:hypothetical protein
MPGAPRWGLGCGFRVPTPRTYMVIAPGGAARRRRANSSASPPRTPGQTRRSRRSSSGSGSAPSAGSTSRSRRHANFQGVRDPHRLRGRDAWTQPGKPCRDASKRRTAPLHRSPPCPSFQGPGRLSSGADRPQGLRPAAVARCGLIVRNDVHHLRVKRPQFCSAPSVCSCGIKPPSVPDSKLILARPAPSVVRYL